MKEEAKEEERPWYRRPFDVLYRHAGTAVFVVVSVVMVIGWFVADIEGASPASAVVFPLVIGGFCAVCVARKWTVLLFELVIALVIGVVSALQLYFGPRFHGQFHVAFLTVLFYFVLGLICGVISEFIRFLHRLTHDLAAKRPSAKR